MFDPAAPARTGAREVLDHGRQAFGVMQEFRARLGPVHEQVVIGAYSLKQRLRLTPVGAWSVGEKMQHTLLRFPKFEPRRALNGRSTG